jgi:hypothetical protein
MSTKKIIITTVVTIATAVAICLGTNWYLNRQSNSTPKAPHSAGSPAEPITPQTPHQAGSPAEPSTPNGAQPQQLDPQAAKTPGEHEESLNKIHERLEQTHQANSFESLRNVPIVKEWNRQSLIHETEELNNEILKSVGRIKELSKFNKQEARIKAIKLKELQEKFTATATRKDIDNDTASIQKALDEIHGIRVELKKTLPES